jgi:uncharacterized protein
VITEPLFRKFIAVNTRDEILNLLRQDKVFIQKSFGVESLALFGSFARNEQRLDSDIDFLVRLKEPKASSLVRLVGYLEKKLNHKVDVVREGPHLSTRFLDFVKKDLTYV